MRLRIAVMAAIAGALAWAPAAAHATVTGSQITSWASSMPGTPANSPYLMSLDNPPTPAPTGTPTTLTVSGTATSDNSSDQVDVVCFYGNPVGIAKLATNVAVTDGAFDTGAVKLRPIAGHACRLRAIPTGSESEPDLTQIDNDSFAGPHVAISEAALPAAKTPGGPPNGGLPYNIYVNDVTFTGFSAWSAAGSPPGTLGAYACGGPAMAPIDSNFNMGNFAIDCAGSLLGDDLGAWGGRSEVQIDGHNAYDAASAQNLFPADTTNDHPASQTLPGFPRTLDASVSWDPSSGLISSRTVESWVACDGPNEETQTYATCPSFVDTGIQLVRQITTSDGGRVVAMTDTWTSTDGNSHSLDLLYDDYVGVFGNHDALRGFEFPGQSGFSQYSGGDSVPAPSGAPGTILVHTDVNAPDGDPSEAYGAITFASAPSGFRFAQTPPSAPVSSDLQEHNALAVPAGGSASLTYVYSVGYSLGDVKSLNLTAQDHIQGLALAITSPGDGTTVDSPSATLTGTASSGSGIAALSVAGQTVPVALDGTWSAQVPLNAGANAITALATDDAGAVAQAQVTVTYQPPAQQQQPAPPPVLTCKVPRTKGLKLPAAERALRRAHCRVGRIMRRHSQAVRRGRVMGTRPHAGHTVHAGSKVALFVSRGR